MKKTIRIKRDNLMNKAATSGAALKETAKKIAQKFIASLKLRFRLRQALSLVFIYALVFAPLLTFDAGVPKAQAQVNIECVIDSPDRIFQQCPLGGEIEAELENQALNDVLAFYNLPDNDNDSERVRSYGRDEMRSFLYARLVELIKKQNPTAREQDALNFFASSTIKRKRVEAARAAQVEHQRWDENACTYTPPAPFTL